MSESPIYAIRICHHHRLYVQCFVCNPDTQRPFKIEATYYNNNSAEFIPEKGEKVKEFYQCKRKCLNCGDVGYTSHPKGQEAEERIQCPNCKTNNYVRG